MNPNRCFRHLLNLELTLVGLVVGLAGTAALTSLLSTVLYQVRPIDRFTYAPVALLSGVATQTACYFHNRRDTRINPIKAVCHDYPHPRWSLINRGSQPHQ